MPNWEKEKEYDFTKKLKADGWAWEFLRRNPEYRKDYKDCCAALEGNPNAIFFEPPKQSPNETDKQWQIQCIRQGVEPRKHRIESWYASKWSLRPPIPAPDSNKTPSFLRTEFPKKPLDLDSVDEYFSAADPDGPQSPFRQKPPYVLLVFNLNQPFKKQITIAEKIIRGAGASLTKHHKGKWTLYLRVLDAYKANAKIKKIASVLFKGMLNGERRVSDTYKAARDLWSLDQYLTML